jgi:acetyltransferase-like isoleucine patch superfamily enzyme
MRFVLSVAIQIALFLLPWRLRRLGLLCLGYRIDRSARIRLSIIHARRVDIGPDAYVGYLNWIAHLDELIIGEGSAISHLNWITGAKPKAIAACYSAERWRVSALRIGTRSGILSRHHIDCSNAVEIGDYTTVGGWGTYIVTHGIEPETWSLSTEPVRIGSRVALGARCTLLKGAVVPDDCLVATHACVVKVHRERFVMLAGVPAEPVKRYSPDCAIWRLGQEGVVQPIAAE